MKLYAERLRRRFGAVRALDSVTFAVDAGEIVGVIGPNGAGKSTVLACVAGLLAPDEGQVFLDGVVVDAPDRRRSMFYLPDGITPWRDQSVQWVLDLAADLFGVSEPWRGEIGERMALGDFTDQRVGNLSKGQRKRVLLAMALAANRPLVLIDEPFDGLDPRQAGVFSDLLRARASAGRTFLLSVHSMSEAVRTCDRHVLLHEGRVVADGSLDALRARAGLAGTATLEEVFIALT